LACTIPAHNWHDWPQSLIDCHHRIKAKRICGRNLDMLNLDLLYLSQHGDFLFAPDL
jgi:hypothetical protein